MQITTCVLVFAVAVCSILAVPTTKCPKNEQFNECGSACEPSCRLPEPFICTMQCIFGCQCQLGFFRNNDGVCVTRQECPNKDLCAGHKCPQGKRCVLMPCFAPKCDPTPECVEQLTA